MIRSLTALAALAVATAASAGVSFVNSIAVPGAATDLSGLGASPNQSRLSFGSDLWYDAPTRQFYGITDRGPGGGLIDYAPRVNIFTLGVNASTGAIGDFQQRRTVVFKTADGTPYSGLTPDRLPGGSKAAVGRSLDSEGFVRLANGNTLVADEYGPSVTEFDRDGAFLRRFATPANLIPRTAGGTPNFTDGRPTITTGRQDNRGFEGLAISADQKTAYAMLQDPLVNEGAQNDGRRSQNLRIVRYDVATGAATGQFIYPLEALADINARLPANNQYGATAQGRNIGISAIYSIGRGKFLVLERDNRGIGVDDPTGTANTVASKRVYLIDINGATDVSNVSLAGSNDLPAGVRAVTKTLFLDINAALRAAGVTVAEKMEGLTLGPRLAGGALSLLIATDNDFSVTQTGNGTQFDVCTSGVGGVSSQVAFGGICPTGQALLPSYLYAFKVDGAAAASLVPEPASWALLIAGFGLVGASLRRRRGSPQAA